MIVLDAPAARVLGRDSCMRNGFRGKRGVIGQYDTQSM